MNLATFDLNLLRVFDAMMAERNVTRAAQRIFLSQPAMSHALARLRKHIGDPLFVRAGADMVPTSKATELGASVKGILDQLGQTFADDRFEPKTAVAVFRIGIVDFAEYALAPMFANLAGEAPNVQVLMQGFDEGAHYSQLASGGLDIAISTPLSPTPGIHMHKIGASELVGLVRAGHPITRGGGTGLGATPRLSVSSIADGVERPLDRMLGAAGITGRVVYTTPHFSAVSVLLLNSDMLLITADIVARMLCAQHPLVAVKLPVQLPPIEPHVIWHERTHRDPAQRWMRNKIIEGTKGLIGSQAGWLAKGELPADGKHDKARRAAPAGFAGGRTELRLSDYAYGRQEQRLPDLAM